VSARRASLPATLSLLVLALVAGPLSGARGLTVYGGALPLYGAGGCVRDIARQAPSERRCPGTVTGLGGADSLTLSPDGRDLYLAAPDDGALVALSRNPVSGGLHPGLAPTGRNCVQAGRGTGRGSSCTRTDPALAGADAVAVSPDGRYVYAGGRDSAAVSGYARGAGGLLAPLPRQISRGATTEYGCVSGFQLGGSPSAGCAARENALVAVSAIAVSPDGRNVYAVSYGLAPGEDSIVALARDPSTGELAPLRGGGGCFQSRPASKCTASAPGLEGARSVIVSPDGRFVYVASDISSAVDVFQRNRVTGRLLLLSGSGGCVSSSSARPSPAPRDVPCAVTVPQLGGARSLALSPDGRQLYVAAFDPGALVALDRDPATGRLAAMAGPPLCLQATPDQTCAAGIPALHGAAGVAVAPGGATVWVACEGGDSVVALRRDAATGRLSLLSSAPTASAPLAAPDALIASGDGRQLYVASPFDDAVAGLGVG
jgi:DNA-binding beta-propeller fold protein YncE